MKELVFLVEEPSAENMKLTTENSEIHREVTRLRLTIAKTMKRNTEDSEIHREVEPLKLTIAKKTMNLTTEKKALSLSSERSDLNFYHRGPQRKPISQRITEKNYEFNYRGLRETQRDGEIE